MSIEDKCDPAKEVSPLGVPDKMDSSGLRQARKEGSGLHRVLADETSHMVVAACLCY